MEFDQRLIELHNGVNNSIHAANLFPIPIILTKYPFSLGSDPNNRDALEFSLRENYTQRCSACTNFSQETRVSDARNTKQKVRAERNDA